MSQRADSAHGWVPVPGTVLDERYRLDEMIDRGGMGVIMRGEHLRMKRVVAVKLLSPNIAAEAGYRARFQREVEVSTTIDHPNVIRCYDFGETEQGVLYLVMELLEGRSLRDLLEAEGRMGLRRAANLTLQLLDGLAAAHLQGVIHRDLKPGNLFVVKDIRGQEVLKVLDFGLAKSLLSDEVRITKTGAICGTASYLAPEALLTDANKPQGDVYAVGLIMLEMLTGTKAFSGWTMAQTFLQQLMTPARIPRRIWETPFGALIAGALKKHPDDRPKNAEGMYQELAAMIEGLPDILLSLDELPPTQTEDLSDELLHKIGSGDFTDLGALRTLPMPEPWDNAESAADVLATQPMKREEVEPLTPAEPVAAAEQTMRIGRIYDPSTERETLEVGAPAGLSRLPEPEPFPAPRPDPLPLPVPLPVPMPMPEAEVRPPRPPEVAVHAPRRVEPPAKEGNPIMTAVIAVAAMGITFGATFAALKGTATDSPENTDPLAREVRPPNPRPTPVTANKPSNSTDAGAEADAGQATPGTAATPKPADAPKSRPRSPAKKGRKRASNATGSPKHGDAEQQPAVEGKESTSESPRQRTLEEALEGLRDE